MLQTTDIDFSDINLLEQLANQLNTKKEQKVVLKQEIVKRALAGEDCNSIATNLNVDPRKVSRELYNFRTNPHRFVEKSRAHVTKTTPIVNKSPEEIIKFLASECEWLEVQKVHKALPNKTPTQVAGLLMKLVNSGDLVKGFCKLYRSACKPVCNTIESKLSTDYGTRAHRMIAHLLNSKNQKMSVVQLSAKMKTSVSMIRTMARLTHSRYFVLNEKKSIISLANNWKLHVK
jgi:hypothetical protein